MSSSFKFNYNMGDSRILVVINQRCLALPSMMSADGTCCNGDENRVIDTFSKLGFQDFVYRNMTTADLKDIVTLLTRHNHRTYSCVVVVILTDGAAVGEIKTADGSYKLRDFMTLFDVDKLRDKPKMFVVQTNRGAKIRRNHCKHASCQCLMYSSSERGGLRRIYSVIGWLCKVFGRSSSSPQFASQQLACLNYTLPVRETIVIYSYVDAFVLYGDTDVGSPVIYELCTALDKFGKSCNILTAITMMQHKVAKYVPAALPVVHMNCTRLMHYGDAPNDVTPSKATITTMIDGCSVILEEEGELSDDDGELRTASK
ncbi:caspase-like protein [Heliothis virescens ascovirus 3e]|uniref:Caspase-like protein n=1 Tax=Heliothis virescens ascovirus 3e TaxID=260797 RepID=CSPL_HVAVE|nr:caspase-like protein [Heliothis virescens ascovirus 3e]A4KXL9.1 RecName: Full=Caspase-like protein [Heliothis virescens ascovirus 3e]ABO37350.1 caspase-like protein [Heliothis virescens ascovirus 3e]